MCKQPGSRQRSQSLLLIHAFTGCYVTSCMFEIEKREHRMHGLHIQTSQTSSWPYWNITKFLIAAQSIWNSWNISLLWCITKTTIQTQSTQWFLIQVNGGDLRVGCGMKDSIYECPIGPVSLMPAKVLCCYTMDAQWLLRAVASVTELGYSAVLCANARGGAPIMTWIYRDYKNVPDLINHVTISCCVAYIYSKSW